MIRDQHFSKVAYFLNKIQNLKRLTNAAEICEALNQYQNEADKRKQRENILPFNYLAVIIPSRDRTIKNNKLEIIQIESLYNFLNIDGVIHTTIFSDLKELIPIPARSSLDEFGTKINKLPIKRLENRVLNINHLKTRE